MAKINNIYYFEFGRRWITSWKDDKTGYSDGYWSGPRWEIQFRLFDYLRLTLNWKTWVWPKQKSSMQVTEEFLSKKKKWS